jgi:hypothetical protein
MVESNVRFEHENHPKLNMQAGFPKGDLDSFCLDNPLKLTVDKKQLFTSEIEQQIAFKLARFGKERIEKDVEDAIYLYRIMKENRLLNAPRLLEWIATFGARKLYEKYLAPI